MTALDPAGGAPPPPDSTAPSAPAAPPVEALPNPVGKDPEIGSGPGSDTSTPAPPGVSDRVLLQGPNPRFRELQLLLRALRDFIRGFRVLHFVGPCVTMFGSARFGETHPMYPVTRELARRISQLGFTVMTGGGPGLMEAANRGARDNGGRSVGCNIELPHEQAPNKYVDRWITCHYFFVRKVLLFKYSYAFIALPGGLGTLDELCEALTLIQTAKIRNYPVVLIGTKYWEPFLVLLREMVAEGAVSDTDLTLVTVTDSIDEAVRYLEAHAVTAFGLKRVQWRQVKWRQPKWWLGENGS